MCEQCFDNVSVLVIGFDGYKDVWNHCFKLMNKYWPYRPNTYLVTSILKPDYEKVTVIAAGPDSEWSKKAMTALKSITSKYVLLLLEDFFISDNVDNEVFNDTIESIKKYNIKFYQLSTQLFDNFKENGLAYKNNRDIVVIPSNKRYPINLQAAIWERVFLMDCIGEGNYNAWEFEVKHMQISNVNTDNTQFLIDNRNILKIIHAVVQSKYLPGALSKLRQRGYEISLNERNVLSKKENFKYQLKLLVYTILPECIRKYFKKLGQLLGFVFVTDKVMLSKKGEKK